MSVREANGHEAPGTERADAPAKPGAQGGGPAHACGPLARGSPAARSLRPCAEIELTLPRAAACDAAGVARQPRTPWRRACERAGRWGGSGPRSCQRLQRGSPTSPARAGPQGRASPGAGGGGSAGSDPETPPPRPSSSLGAPRGVWSPGRSQALAARTRPPAPGSGLAPWSWRPGAPRRAVCLGRGVCGVRGVRGFHVGSRPGDPCRGAMASESVKVVVRCRPMNQRELELNCQAVVTVDSARGQCFIQNPGASDEPPKQFTFDGAYYMDHFTEQIYNEIAYPLVEVRAPEGPPDRPPLRTCWAALGATLRDSTGPKPCGKSPFGGSQVDAASRLVQRLFSRQETAGTHLLYLCPGPHHPQCQGCPHPTHSRPSPTRTPALKTTALRPHARAQDFSERTATLLPQPPPPLPKAGVSSSSSSHAWPLLSPPSASRTLSLTLLWLPERLWQLQAYAGGKISPGPCFSKGKATGLALSWSNGNPCSWV